MSMSAYLLLSVFVDLPVVDEPHREEAINVDDGLLTIVLKTDVRDSPDRGFIKDMLSVSSERLAPTVTGQQHQ